MTSDWYRHPGWDEPDRAEFERRLSRARSASKPQYLRIKALAVLGAGDPDAARQLFERVIRDHPDHAHEAAFATEQLGDISRRDGNGAAAEHYYRGVLRDWPSLNGTSHMVEVSLAELLIERNDPGRRHEARALLDSRYARGSMFNNDLFRWYVALARLANQDSDRATQREAATKALALVGRPAQLPRHPNVGLASADPDTLAWLRKVAG